jgi:hypothetical protein
VSSGWALPKTGGVLQSLCLDLGRPSPLDKEPMKGTMVQN